MMMKYLPGDSLIGGSNATLKARCQILSDWQSDVTSVISATHNKLNKLGSDKIVDTSDTVKDLVPEAPPTSPTSIKREVREKKPARRGRDSVQKMKERKEI